MKNNVRTKLQAYADGQNMRKRRYKKQKKSSPKELVQKQSQPIREEVERIQEEKNVVFKPNKGPQTEFLAANEREVLY